VCGINLGSGGLRQASYAVAATQLPEDDKSAKQQNRFAILTKKKQRLRRCFFW
jgi:hypothetical protein